MDSDSSEVHLYVYDMTRGMAKVMSAAILGKQIDGVWHTGIVVHGKEYFFGSAGIQSCDPGTTILGQPDKIEKLGSTQITYDIFIEYVRGLADSQFRGEAYHLLENNCNNFSNELAQFLCGQTIPQHIVDLPNEVMNTAFGQSLQPLLASLSASAGGSGIPVLAHLDLERAGSRQRRSPSPDAVQLERAIEQSRRDSYQLEQRRQAVVEKAKRLEKRLSSPNKSQSSSSSQPSSSSSSTNPATTTEKMADDQAAAAPAEVQEETRAPREPPIVYKDAVDVKKDYETLLECITKVGTPDDQQSMAELKQYVIDDEGSWALGDNFLIFIGKWLNDDQPSNDTLRVKLLNVLAAAALKDDVILILHQDRRDHVLMNYAHNIDRLPLSEQDALSLFICNLFENGSSSEWLLYISEWQAPHTTLPLSNIRVTTKVAVTALLSDNATLQERGTAILYNLAIKEKMETTRQFSDLLPRGSLSKVFDDVATELSMAILQFFSSEHNEEHIFRCMKGLTRFAYISQEVPALIKMIGPDPSQFKGMSARVDELVIPLLDRLRSVRGFE